MWKSGSYERASPSIVISALNSSVRSDGITIEWSRTIAENCRSRLPMRMSFSGTPWYSTDSSLTSPASVARPRSVARPVEQNVDHRLLVHLRDAVQQIDDLVAAHRRQAPDHAEVDHARCGCPAGRRRCPGAGRRGRSRRPGSSSASPRRRARRAACGRVRPRRWRQCRYRGCRRCAPGRSATRSCSPIHARHHDVRVAFEVLAEALDVARLEREIELALERARDLARRSASAGSGAPPASPNRPGRRC